MRLHRENHQVLRTHRTIVVACPHVASDVFAAIAHNELHALSPDYLQIQAAHEEGDVLASERKLYADVSSDGASTDDRNFHRISFMTAKKCAATSRHSR